MGREGGVLCVCGRVASPGIAAWIGRCGKAGEESDAVYGGEREVENVVDEVGEIIPRKGMYVWRMVLMKGRLRK
jgi:hypothetical protein